MVRSNKKIWAFFALGVVVLCAIVLIQRSESPSSESPTSSQAELSASDRARAYYIRLSSLAENGDPNAQRELAARYIQGEELSKNVEKGLKWLLKAAEGGNQEAQYEMGMIYFQGEAVAEDMKQAEFWMKKAADAGFISAQRELATWYLAWKDASGQAHTRDHDAFIYMEKAAIRGDADAQYILGEMYYSGMGVDEDKEKAKEWWETAKDLGHERAFQRFQREI